MGCAVDSLPDSRRFCGDGSGNVDHHFSWRQQRRAFASGAGTGIGHGDVEKEVGAGDESDLIQPADHWREFQLGLGVRSAILIGVGLAHFLFDQFANLARMLAVEGHPQGFGQWGFLRILHGHAHPADHLDHCEMQPDGQRRREHQDEADAVEGFSGHDGISEIICGEVVSIYYVEMIFFKACLSTAGF